LWYIDDVYHSAVAERKQRLSIEVLPEEVMLLRQVRASAVLKGVSLREWVLEALREKLARES
jgi:hypothetical protein